MINIYIETDLKGLKGKAHYGYILEWARPGMDIKTKEGFGEVEDTKNRIFLRAANEALERINRAEEVHVYAPCQYMTENANKGMPEMWCLHGWVKGDKKEVMNKDLWGRMLTKLRELKPVWHNGKHAYSEVILMKLKEMEHGTAGNGTQTDGSGHDWNNGASPYHF